MFKSVAICIPTHSGSVSTQTLSSVVQAMSSPRNIAVFNVTQSLLARTFNNLFINAWCSNCDYMMLLHADIGVYNTPGHNWIDTLIGTMDEFQAMALSVPSPIKNELGHLSAGIVLDPNNQHCLRRTTVRELAELPKSIITRGDLCKLYDLDPSKCGAMLINTGALLLNISDFREEWKKWDGFSIEDRIVWNRQGIPKEYTQPEDWKFSHWLWENGHPYYMTQRVELEHVGSSPFRNRGEWGDQADTCERICSTDEWKNS